MANQPVQSRSRRRSLLERMVLCALVSGMTITMIADSANAQTTATQVLAKEQFDAGQKAVEKGELRRARVLFLASSQAFSTTGTLLNLADCEEQLHLYASALRHFREALATLPPTDGRIPFTKGRITALEPREPKLRVVLAASAPADSRVLLDSRELSSASIDTNMSLDPGKYTITVVAKNRVDHIYAVTLVEKQAATLSVEAGASLPLPAVESAARPVTTSAPAQPLQTGSDDTLLGVGAALAGFGLIAGPSLALAGSLDDSAYSTVGGNGRDIQRGVAIAAGITAVVVGTILIVVGVRQSRVSSRVRASSGAQVVPVPDRSTGLTLQGAGLTLRGSF